MFIRPKLEYASSVYGNNLNQVQIDSLESIQRQALICCTRAYKHTSHIKLLEETGVEPLTIRRKYFRLCHIFKMVNRMTPRYLMALLPPYVYEVSRYSLRNSNDLYKPKIRKGYLLNSFLWSAVDDWNRLDIGIRSLPSLSIFKQELKKLYFYEDHKLYNVGSGYGHINHARMRMGLSGLNAHRKKYNYIDCNEYPKYDSRPENDIHFYLQCPAYANQRTILVGTLQHIILSNVNLNINIDPRSKAELTKLNALLLYGDTNLSDDDNITLFKAVHKYIVDTKRF